MKRIHLLAAILIAASIATASATVSQASAAGFAARLPAMHQTLSRWQAASDARKFFYLKPDGGTLADHATCRPLATHDAYMCEAVERGIQSGMRVTLRSWAVIRLATISMHAINAQPDAITRYVTLADIGRELTTS